MSLELLLRTEQTAGKPTSKTSLCSFGSTRICAHTTALATWPSLVVRPQRGVLLSSILCFPPKLIFFFCDLGVTTFLPSLSQVAKSRALAMVRHFPACPTNGPSHTGRPALYPLLSPTLCVHGLPGGDKGIAVEGMPKKGMIRRVEGSYRALLSPILSVCHFPPVPFLLK